MRRHRNPSAALLLCAFPLTLGTGCNPVPGTDDTSPAQGSFVHWESPHVNPLALSPSATKMFAVNTPDNRVEIFDVTAGTPLPIGSVPVGLDPVSVRARTDDEVWVVNRVSDSISIVSVGAR